MQRFIKRSKATPSDTILRQAVIALEYLQTPLLSVAADTSMDERRWAAEASDALPYICDDRIQLEADMHLASAYVQSKSGAFIASPSDWLNVCRQCSTGDRYS